LTRFAIATRDELWSHGRLRERRLSHGDAIDTADGIVATDTRDDALLVRCEELMEHLRACVLPDLRMRLVAEVSTEGETQTITVTHNGNSIVTTPEHIANDIALLRNADVAPAEQAASRRPLLWKNGTAAVMLHEAFGHPLEQGHADVQWPTWFHIDAPLRMRRATFRDVPLLRMTTLTASQTSAPFELAHEHIEITLIAGGHYEPLTGFVTLHVAAATMNHVPLAPFVIEATREEIARSIRGARGEPIRYPGVICSREGQELVVGSYAPELLTLFS
jgi:hypothetical protein